MNFKCLAYRALDRSRRWWIMEKTVYKGGKPLFPGKVTATATVRGTSSNESDGDVTFHVDIDKPDERGAYRHVEVTPCNSDDVRTRCRSLKVGDRIKITGDERYDPGHWFDGGGPAGSQKGAAGWWEIHGVDDIENLPKETA